MLGVVDATWSFFPIGLLCISLPQGLTVVILRGIFITTQLWNPNFSRYPIFFLILYATHEITDLNVQICEVVHICFVTIWVSVTKWAKFALIDWLSFSTHWFFSSRKKDQIYSLFGRAIKISLFWELFFFKKNIFLKSTFSEKQFVFG